MNQNLHQKIVITGSNGFIGQNLHCYLSSKGFQNINCVFHSDDDLTIKAKLTDASIIFHLAGVNRPTVNTEFDEGNVGFTTKIIQLLNEIDCKPLIVFTSSSQVHQSNDYGDSKLKAEDIIQQSKLQFIIYRLTNIFGKWCKPNYNSVVATFCHNLIHDKPINITDRKKVVKLVYIDDVMMELYSVIVNPIQTSEFRECKKYNEIELGKLFSYLKSIHNNHLSHTIGNLKLPLYKQLRATYISHLPFEKLTNQLETHSDDRGDLAEFYRSNESGQVFLSKTKIGHVRGNHFHNTKTEKFLVIQGKAIIRLKSLICDEILKIFVDGSDFRIVNIPPGYAHSIQNIGQSELLTIFWASEPYNQDFPDTYQYQVTGES